MSVQYIWSEYLEKLYIHVWQVLQLKNYLFYVHTLYVYTNSFSFVLTLKIRFRSLSSSILVTYIILQRKNNFSAPTVFFGVSRIPCRIRRGSHATHLYWKYLLYLRGYLKLEYHTGTRGEVRIRRRMLANASCEVVMVSILSRVVLSNWRCYYTFVMEIYRY